MPGHSPTRAAGYSTLGELESPIDATRAKLDRVQIPPSSDLSLVGSLLGAGAGEEGLTQYFAALLRDAGVRRTYLNDLLRVRETAHEDALVIAEDNEASKKGTPDVSITVGGLLRVIVENKLGASFTDNQPHEYVKSLLQWKLSHPEGEVMLVLHAPEHRMQYLQPKLWRLLAANCPGVVRDGSCFGGVRIRLVPWEQIGELLRDYVSTVNDPVLAFLVRSFVNLLPRRVGAVPVPVSGDNLMLLMKKEVVEAIVAAERLIQSLRQSLSHGPYHHKVKVYAELDGQSLEVTPLGEGAKTDSTQRFYVGVYPRVGAHFGVSPFLLHLYGSAYVNPNVPGIIPGPELAVVGWYERPAVPLTVTPDVDSPDQVRLLADQIERVRRQALG